MPESLYYKANDRSHFRKAIFLSEAISTNIYNNSITIQLNKQVEHTLPTETTHTYSFEAFESSGNNSILLLLLFNGFSVPLKAIYIGLNRINAKSTQ